MFIWRPSTIGIFSTKLVWEITRAKGSPQIWLDWIWNKLLPKKISICMWKAHFSYLLTDKRVKSLGIPLVFGYNYCVVQNEGSRNHVLSMDERSPVIMPIIEEVVAAPLNQQLNFMLLQLEWRYESYFFLSRKV